MMKKLIVLLSISFLVFSGCSKKKPKPTNMNTNEIVQDTISVDENSFGSGNGESGDSSGHNSSTDGMQSLYFAFGDYGLTSEMQQTISFNSGILNKKLGSSRVKLEGNCDEFGTDEYNFALGLKRAKAVKDGLLAQGINDSKIILMTYGESNPRCTNMTESCYAQNRRVDLHILR